MYLKKLFAGCALLFASNLMAQTPNVLLLNPEHILAQKELFQKGDPKLIKEVNVVISQADKVLHEDPASVMQKTIVPPSGTKHDYMSLAPYFWPDPTKPDGLPYIRKDGEINPEVKNISDSELFSELETCCKFLSLAYYFTGDEKYAAKETQLISYWFLAPESKMNPNLNYAQAIRGVNDGRGIGIIESRCLANLADWMTLLTGSASFNTTDQNGMKKWYAEYLGWLQTSENGKDEKKSKNNHGTNYDVQIVALALFTGNSELAKKILNDAKKRIDLQIEADGKQPLELTRTKAYDYSTLNLTAWFDLATMGDRVNINLWQYATPAGGTIRKALDWLIPYTVENKQGGNQQIVPYNLDDLYPLLIIAGAKYNDKHYSKEAGSIPFDHETNLADLLYGNN